MRDGKAPPASRYPKLSDKTLVRPNEVKFPRIPNVHLPDRVHQAFHLDFGPQWKNRIITKQPPGVGSAFPVFVPQVDENGNDLGGVRLPELEVPLATYTGWNLRDPKTGMPNERVAFIGSYLPLPNTKNEDAGDAQAAGDRSVVIVTPRRGGFLAEAGRWCFSAKLRATARSGKSIRSESFPGTTA